MANDVELIPPNPVGVLPGSGMWNDWIEKIRFAVNNTLSGFTWSMISNFGGSNLNQIATRNFSDLQGIPSNSHTIPLVKLTGGGANGSITFVNGLITAWTDPT